MDDECDRDDGVAANFDRLLIGSGGGGRSAGAACFGLAFGGC